MNLNLSNILDCVETAFSNSTKSVEIFKHSITQFRKNLPIMTKRKPYKAKEVAIMLKIMKKVQ